MKSGPAQQRPAQSTASTRLVNGTNTLTANLLWAFGVGRAGQSYLFKREDGKFYEARVTYFDTLKTIDFTPARALTSPKNIEEAMFRPVGSEEITRCFACHTTAVCNHRRTL